MSQIEVSEIRKEHCIYGYNFCIEHYLVVERSSILVCIWSKCAA